MGFFSWICSASGQSIPSSYVDDSPVVLVLPDNTTVCGKYDGYGRIVFDKHAEQYEKEIANRFPFAYEPDENAVDIFMVLAHYVVPHIRTRDQVFCEKHYDLITQHIKLVKRRYYDFQPNVHTWGLLDVSESCPFQGYFYPYAGAWTETVEDVQNKKYQD